MMGTYQSGLFWCWEGKIENNMLLHGIWYNKSIIPSKPKNRQPQIACIQNLFLGHSTRVTQVQKSPFVRLIPAWPGGFGESVKIETSRIESLHVFLYLAAVSDASIRRDQKVNSPTPFPSLAIYSGDTRAFPSTTEFRCKRGYIGMYTPYSLPW